MKDVNGAELPFVFKVLQDYFKPFSFLHTVSWQQVIYPESFDDLANAILAIQSRTDVPLQKKELLVTIQKQNSNWKLTERRVSKYTKKLHKYESQARSKSQTALDESENGDDESAASNASNASVVARRILTLGSSIKKSLSLRGSDKLNNVHVSMPDALQQENNLVRQVDCISTPPKQTNLLPDLDDDNHSFSEDEGFKAADTSMGTADETLSPQPGDSFDADLEKDPLDDVQATLSIDKKLEAVDAGLVESKDLNKDHEDIPYTFKDDNDGKKEGLVCHGCVIL